MALPTFLEYFALDASATERDIKRAYARKLKTLDPQLAAAEFYALREHYQQALGWASMVENNPDLAKLIWGDEAVPRSEFDLEPTKPIEPGSSEQNSSARPVNMAQSSVEEAVEKGAVDEPREMEQSTGFDVAADAPWSAEAELDSLLAGLNVNLDPKRKFDSDEHLNAIERRARDARHSRIDFNLGFYKRFEQSLAATIQRLSDADGGLEKSEAFELECLRNLANERFKGRYALIDTSQIMPIVESRFGWDEQALSNRARELDGWAAQRFYALKHEYFFIEHLDRYLENPRADLLMLLQAKSVPTGKDLLKWKAVATSEGDLKKIRSTIDAFEQHCTDDSKYIKLEVKQFWRAVDPKTFNAKEKRIAYFYNNQSTVYTFLALALVVWGLNLLNHQFFHAPNFESFLFDTASFLGLLLAVCSMGAAGYLIYFLIKKSGISKSGAWLWFKSVPTFGKWLIVLAGFSLIGQFLK